MTTQEHLSQDASEERDFYNDASGHLAAERITAIAARVFNNHSETGDSAASNALDVYFRDFRGTQVLDREEEIELARYIECGESAREELKQLSADINNTGDNESLRAANPDNHTVDTLRRYVKNGEHSRDVFIRANLRLVVSIASEYKRRQPNCEFGDLIQYGNEGLITAVDKFDWRYGSKFSTYATWWISQRIQRGIIHQHLINTPEGLHRHQRTISRVRDSYRQSGHEPTIQEISFKTGLSEEDILNADAYMYTMRSLQQPIYKGRDDGELTHEDTLSSPDDVEGDAIRMEQYRWLYDSLERLNDRERMVIIQRFGLYNEQPKTLQAIGRELGVSREYVRHIETSAKGRLHDIFSEQAAYGSADTQ